MDEAAQHTSAITGDLLPPDNTTFVCDVEEILENSFFDSKSLNLGYALTLIEPIKNENTTETYNECRKTLEKDAKSKRALVERYLIYLVPNTSDLDTIRRDGCLSCLTQSSDNISSNIFAKSTAGIHLHKHLDILLRNSYRKRASTVHCVLVKASIDLNKICVAQPACLKSSSSQELPPSSCCHCLISTELTNSSDDIELQSANSTMFIYGSDSQNPPNLLPFAVLKFQMEDPSFHDENIYARKRNEPMNDSFLSVSFNDSDTTAADTLSLATFQTTTDTSSVLARSADFKQTQFELISKNQKATPSKKKFSFSKKHPSPVDLHSPACQLNVYFQPSANAKVEEPADTTTHLESIDRISYERLPRWRYVYELSGQKRKLFRGRIRCLVRLSDIIKANPLLKFSNLRKTAIDLKHMQNRYLLPATALKGSKLNDHKKASLKSSSTSCGGGFVQKSEKPLTKPSSSRTTPKQPEKPLKKTPTAAVVKPANASTESVKAKENVNSSSNNSAKSTPKSAKSKSSTPSLKDETLGVDSSGLSSEMTALEKRLLGLDKKKPLKAKPNIAETNKTACKLSLNLEKVSQKVKLEPEASNKLKIASASIVKEVKTTASASVEVPAKPKDIQEELRKISAKLKAEKKQEESTKKPASVAVKTMLREEKEAVKRKKSFWDPDSDTEYDLAKKQSRGSDVNSEGRKSGDVKVKSSMLASEVKETDEDEYDNDTEYVIVSKQHLNVQPIQYSKSFYDLNMNGLEHELKRFSPSDACNSLSPHTQTVTKHIKTPIEPPTAAAPTTDLKTTQLKAAKSEPQFANKQRPARLYTQPKFIHHYITSTHRALKTPQPYTQVVMSQFDVDSLKSLRAKSKSYVNLSKTELLCGDSALVEIVCHEIHAGGFRCIEEHQFQKSASYLRRTQSFQACGTSVSPAVNRDEQQGNLMCQKKISLTDYVSTRGGAKSSGTSTPAQVPCFNSYPNSINSIKTPNSCENHTNGVAEAEEMITIKIDKIEPSSPVPLSQVTKLPPTLDLIKKEASLPASPLNDNNDKNDSNHTNDNNQNNDNNEEVDENFQELTKELSNLVNIPTPADDTTTTVNKKRKSKKHRSLVRKKRHSRHHRHHSHRKRKKSVKRRKKPHSKSKNKKRRSSSSTTTDSASECSSSSADEDDSSMSSESGSSDFSTDDEDSSSVSSHVSSLDSESSSGGIEVDSEEDSDGFRSIKKRKHSKRSSRKRKSLKAKRRSKKLPRERSRKRKSPSAIRSDGGENDEGECSDSEETRDSNRPQQQEGDNNEREMSKQDNDDSMGECGDSQLGSERADNEEAENGGGSRLVHVDESTPKSGSIRSTPTQFSNHRMREKHQTRKFFTPTVAVENKRPAGFINTSLPIISPNNNNNNPMYAISNVKKGGFNNNNINNASRPMYQQQTPGNQFKKFKTGSMVSDSFPDTEPMPIHNQYQKFNNKNFNSNAPGFQNNINNNSINTNMNFQPPINDHYNPMNDALISPNMNNSLGPGHFTNALINNSANFNTPKPAYNKGFNKNNSQMRSFNNNNNNNNSQFNNSNNKNTLESNTMQSQLQKFMGNVNKIIPEIGVPYNKNFNQNNNVNSGFQNNNFGNNPNNTNFPMPNDSANFNSNIPNNNYNNSNFNNQLLDSSNMNLNNSYGPNFKPPTMLPGQSMLPNNNNVFNSNPSFNNRKPTSLNNNNNNRNVMPGNVPKLDSNFGQGQFNAFNNNSNNNNSNFNMNNSANFPMNDNSNNFNNAMNQHGQFQKNNQSNQGDVRFNQYNNNHDNFTAGQHQHQQDYKNINQNQRNNFNNNNNNNYNNISNKFNNNSPNTFVNNRNNFNNKPQNFNSNKNFNNFKQMNRVVNNNTNNMSNPNMSTASGPSKPLQPPRAAIDKEDGEID